MRLLVAGGALKLQRDGFGYREAVGQERWGGKAGDFEVEVFVLHQVEFDQLHAGALPGGNGLVGIDIGQDRVFGDRVDTIGGFGPQTMGLGQLDHQWQRVGIGDALGVDRRQEEAVEIGVAAPAAGAD